MMGFDAVYFYVYVNTINNRDDLQAVLKKSSAKRKNIPYNRETFKCYLLLEPVGKVNLSFRAERSGVEKSHTTEMTEEVNFSTYSLI